jgi:hypothetical protein
LKTKLVLVALLAGLVLAGGAKAAHYVERPTIHEGEARSHALHFLNDYPGWRYRKRGYLDCRYGRINRYTWACRAGWISGAKCRLGRMRIQNDYREGSLTYFSTSFGSRRC